MYNFPYTHFLGWFRVPENPIPVTRFVTNTHDGRWRIFSSLRFRSIWKINSQIALFEYVSQRPLREISQFPLLVNSQYLNSRYSRTYKSFLLKSILTRKSMIKLRMIFKFKRSQWGKIGKINVGIARLPQSLRLKGQDRSVLKFFFFAPQALFGAAKIFVVGVLP